MTPGRRVSRYVWAMRFFALLYLLVGLGFFFFPNEVFYLINVGPKVFKLTEAVPDPTERFWLVLATSMMAMLAAVSLLASVHLVSKICSTAGFAYQFLHHQNYFAYVLGILTDGPIALIVLWLALRTPFKPPEQEALT